MTNTTAVHCTVCKKPGARWLMRVDGEPATAVHKPCGKRVQAAAPQGQTCKVFPSKELRQEWDVQAFWAGKFKEARAKAGAPQPTSDQKMIAPFLRHIIRQLAECGVAKVREGNMIGNLIFGFVLFCFEMVLGLLRGLIALVGYIFGWPVIMATVVIVWTLWRFGFI